MFSNQDEESGDDVVDHRLRAKADDEAENPGAGQERHRIESERPQDQHGRDEVGDVHERAAHQRHHRRSTPAFALFEPLARQHAVADLHVSKLDDQLADEEDRQPLDHERSPGSDALEPRHLIQRQRYDGDPERVLQAGRETSAAACENDRSSVPSRVAARTVR